MVKISVTLHPSGLAPDQAAKAWYLRIKEKSRWNKIQEEVVNLQGGEPSETCLRLAVNRVQQKGKSATLKSNYSK